MKVLIGGETSGKTRDAFRKLGHDAVSCDLLPTDVPGPHLQMNYWEAAKRRWDLAIFHPTCTFMCNSGVRWLYEEEGRWEKMVEASEDFARLLELPYPVVCENPVMHGYAARIVGRGPDQIVQPWMFGHEATKATGYWMNDEFMKRFWLLRATFDLGPPRTERERKDWAIIHRAPPGLDRWKFRSETFQGIADAMAWQWGGRVKGLQGSMVRLEHQLGLLERSLHGSPT